MQDIAAWLNSLGLGQYAQAFADNAIDASVLPTLTNDDLKELGVLLGHRKILFQAIAQLAPSASPQAASREPAEATAAPATPVVPAGERRHLTVMFCDLVGSTPLAASMDAEDWRDIAAEYHRTAAEAVNRFGGYLAQKFGDGVLVYFGYPVAQENDAERAARAGLAILEGINALNARVAAGKGPQLAVRIGIHSGPAVLTETAGVFGDVANVASRVQTAAEPGSLLVSQTVHRQIAGRFISEDLGRHTLKGVAEPMALYKVLRAAGERGRIRPKELTSLIGREEELNLLLGRWKKTQSGEGQVALIVGEPGIGKSRLAEALRQKLADAPHTWVECPASQLLQNSPFHPFAAWMRQRFGGSDEPQEHRLAALESAVAAVGLVPEEAVPVLAELIDLPLGDRYPAKPVSPIEKRRQQFNTLMAWILAAAKAQPLVIHQEDIHWADPSTLEFLQILVDQITDAPILLLMTARPEFKAPWPVRSHHSQLILAPLDRHDARRMVSELAERHSLASEVLEAVMARSGGVPLFVEELMSLMLESRSEGESGQIPATLQSALTARLDRLGPARDVAQICAVLGQEFSYPLLLEVAGSNEPLLQLALQQLTEADLLHGQGLPPTARYRFKHALIRDAAYGTLLKERRRELHRLVAQGLSGPFKELAEAQPELLAHHFTEAGLMEAACESWNKAGAYSMGRSSYAEAVANFGRVLEVADGLPDTAASWLLRLRAQIAQGNAYVAFKGHTAPETMTAFEKAREMTARIGDANERVRILFGLFAIYYTGSAIGSMRDIAAQLQAEQGKCALAPARAGIELMAALTAGAQGFLSSEMAHLEAIIGLLGDTPAGTGTAEFAIDVLSAAYIFYSYALWVVGRIDAASDYARRAGERAEASGSAYSISLVMQLKVFFDSVRRENDLRLPDIQRLLTFANQHGFRESYFLAEFGEGVAQALLGDFAAAVITLRRIHKIMADAGYDSSRVVCLARLGWVELMAGDPDAGLALVGEAEDLINAKGGAFRFLPEVLAVRADILLRQRKPDSIQAEAVYREAMRLARNQGAKSYELRAATGLANLLADQLRRAEAADVLAPIYGEFTEGFGSRLLLEAKAALERVQS